MVEQSTFIAPLVPIYTTTTLDKFIKVHIIGICEIYLILVCYNRHLNTRIELKKQGLK